MTNTAWILVPQATNPVAFDHPIKQALAGIATTDSEPGEQLKIMVAGSLVPEDGDMFWRASEDLTGPFAKAIIDAGIFPTQMSTLLVIMGGDSAHIVVNPEVQVEIGVKRSIEAGQPVTSDDISDVHRLRLPGISIGADKGVALIMRQNWRSFMYFDFQPMGPDRKAREHDLELEFGALAARQMFREVFESDPAILEKMFEAGWFPFTQLLSKPFRTLYDAYRSEKGIEGAEGRVCDAVDSDFLRGMHSRWQARPNFEDHSGFIATAIERHEANDWISAISVLVPRIDNMLARLMASETGDKISRFLARVGRARRRWNVLAPELLGEYLRAFFWKHYRPDDESIPVSRHAVAHGDAPEDKFSRRHAAQLFLFLDHLYYLVPEVRIEGESEADDEGDA